MKKDKISILIVEDEAPIRTALENKLEEVGFHILTAENGEQGLRLAFAEEPQLILLDILMPVMDGTTMMEKLRESSEYGKEVPVILLTNLSPDEEKIMTSIDKNNPAYYLIKSDINLDEVVEKIKEVLA